MLRGSYKCTKQYIPLLVGEMRRYLVNWYVALAESNIRGTVLIFEMSSMVKAILVKKMDFHKQI